MNIFERMAAARARALVLKQHCLGWKVNRAALAALSQEGAFDEAGPEEKLSLFGLPITLETEDRSSEPLFWLVAELLEQKNITAH